jgi:hypothetical protein
MARRRMREAAIASAIKRKRATIVREALQQYTNLVILKKFPNMYPIRNCHEHRAAK